MSIALVVGIIVVLIILIILIYNAPEWAPLSYWIAHYVENPWKVYQRSAGTFDDAAALALERIRTREFRSPRDDMLCATIITRNILSQEHRMPIITTNTLERAQLEHAQMRHELFHEARNHFINALNGPPDPGIIDAVLEFAFEGLNLLITNEPLLADLDYPHIVLQQDLNGQVFAVDQILAFAATNRHQENIRQRVATAGAAVTPAAATAAYIDLATCNTTDLQNVHDPSVLACLKAIIDRLRIDQSDEALPSFDDIKLEIQVYGDGHKQRVLDVNAVINATAKGERVIAIGATDAECLQRVWMRSTDPKNAAVRNKMRTAVFDALYDCWETGIMDRNIVCVNGRTSRILTALILLDWDERNWEVKKLEQFKNDIFAEAANVIKLEATAASRSLDTDQRRAGLQYLAQSLVELNAIGTVSDTAVAELAEKMRTAISMMVNTYVQSLDDRIKDAIPSYMIAAIIEEARAAVM